MEHRGTNLEQLGPETMDANHCAMLSLTNLLIHFLYNLFPNGILIFEKQMVLLRFLPTTLCRGVIREMTHIWAWFEPRLGPLKDALRSKLQRRGILIHCQELVLPKSDWILQKFLKNRDKGDKMKPQKSSLHFVRLGCHLLQQQQKTSQGEKKLQQREKKIRK